MASAGLGHDLWAGMRILVAEKKLTAFIYEAWAGCARFARFLNS
jgi:hypothetical protein